MPLTMPCNLQYELSYENRDTYQPRWTIKNFCIRILIQTQEHWIQILNQIAAKI